MESTLVSNPKKKDCLLTDFVNVKDKTNQNGI